MTILSRPFFTESELLLDGRTNTLKTLLSLLCYCFFFFNQKKKKKIQDLLYSLVCCGIYCIALGIYNYYFPVIHCFYKTVLCDLLAGACANSVGPWFNSVQFNSILLSKDPRVYKTTYYYIKIPTSFSQTLTYKMQCVSGQLSISRHHFNDQLPVACELACKVVKGVSLKPVGKKMYIFVYIMKACS